MAFEDDELQPIRGRVLDLEERSESLRKQLKGIQDELEMARRRSLYQLGNIGAANLSASFTTDIKFYKNLVWNSSFENPGPDRKAKFWTVGVCTAAAAWYSTCALLLKPGEVSEQETLAYVDPAWYGGGRTRVALAHKFGALRVEVVNDLGKILHVEDYAYVADWPLGKHTFVFDPGTAAKVFLRLTNRDATADAYIDSVQMEPDLTKKWPSLYSDGPYSLPAAAPSARVMGAPGTAIPAGVWTRLAFPTKLYDTYDLVNAKPGFESFLFSNREGIVHVWANVGFTSVTPQDPYYTYSDTLSGDVSGSSDPTTGSFSGSSSTPITVRVPPRLRPVRGIRLVHVSGKVLASKLFVPAETDQTHMDISTTYQMKAGEYVSVEVYTDEAGVSTANPVEFAMTILGD